MGTAKAVVAGKTQNESTIMAAEAVIRCLEEKNVKYIFGYPGGAVLPLYDALAASPIKHILVRHEQAAAHAADGYARATGRPGVCLATSGPGACNLVTGLATAYMDSVPVLAITGQVATGYVGTDAFQEVDITGITMPITKHNYLVKKAQDLPRIIAEAFHIATTGRPGPVLIDIPKNVAETLIAYSGIPAFNLRGYRPTYKGHHTQIVNAAKMIMRAERPLIYVGGGVVLSGAAPQLRQLAEQLNIPVALTLSALGALPAGHSLSLGMLGIHGSIYANLAVEKCDCLIALGCRFDERVTNDLPQFAPLAQVIHIDIDPAEIGKNRRVNLPLVGDLRLILTEMLTLLQGKREAAWLEQIAVWKKQYPLDCSRNQTGQLQVQQVIKKIADLTGGQAVVVSDVGQHQMWTAQYYPFSEPRHFISSGGLGTMGYALPAAIGAGLGLGKQQKLYVMVGDGGFQMNLAELATAAENQVPLVILLFNNRRLNLVRQLQQVYYNQHYFAVDFPSTPAFEKLGEVYGIKSYAIHNINELEQALEATADIWEPVLLNCIVARDENVEPMLLSGRPVDSEMPGKE